MIHAPVRIEGLTLSHDRVVAVSGLTGQFAPGSLTAIAGPNGAGKTTLLRAIAGLHRPAAGRIDLGGIVRSRIALLGQASGLDRGFPISCQEMVALGHWGRVGALSDLTARMRYDAGVALDAVGLADFGARPVGALSTGQFQRALFARLLVQDADLLLLDEPFNAVDERTAADLLALIKTWHAAGRTIIAALHDLGLIASVFSDTLLLARQPISWGPTALVLTPANLRRARMGAEVDFLAENLPDGLVRHLPAA